MSIRALQEYTYFSKYARYNKEAQRRETWAEAVQRVKEMHLRRYPEVAEEIEWAFEQVRQRRVLGSQRALQYGGEPVEKKHAREYNCVSSFCDRPKFFQEAFWLLLCGCGTGFSVQRHHVAKLPDLRSDHPSERETKTFLVPDTIEGWADSLGVLLSTYIPHEDPAFDAWGEYNVEFDFSAIRPAGSPLSSGAGKAPGPDPLRNSLVKVRGLLDRCMAYGQTRLRPVDAYDVVMHTSDAVLAGGVRRSASIAIFSPDDMEMVQAKTGNWLEENPQRARSNNSALLLRQETCKAEFESLFESVRQFGEPGFYWSDSTEQVPNPSLRKGTRVITSNGIFPIESLEGKTFLVKNLHGKWEEAVCRLSGRDKDLVKVRLVGGHEYYATREHKWPVYNARRRGFFKKDTVELKPGDKLPIITESTLFDGVMGDYDDGFILGWLYGDGCVTTRSDNGKTQYGFIVSKKDAEGGILDKLNSILQAKIPGTTENWTARKTSCFEKSIVSKGAHEYFTSLGFAPKENGLPDTIWTCSEQMRLGFVDGILSADGSVNNSLTSPNMIVCFSSSREKMVNDLSDLLGFYGIKTSRYHYIQDGSKAKFPNGKSYNRSYHCYLLRLMGKDSGTHFLRVFALSHQHKQQRLERWTDDGFIPSFQRTIKVDSVEETGLQEDVWDLSVRDNTHCFQIPHCITGNCVEIAFHPVDLDTGKSGWQMCVRGDTKLVTANGITNIEDAVNSSISIWNGDTWSKVTPTKTGSDRTLYRVHLGDGSFLDCTANHRWLAGDRFSDFQEMTTSEIADSLSSSPYALRVPRSNMSHPGTGVSECGAYEYGFMLGDGTYRPKHSPFALLCGEDITLPLKGSRGTLMESKPGYQVPTQHISFTSLDRDLSQIIKNEPGLSTVFSWDEHSIKSFLGGWIDADGTKVNSGCRIYGREDNIRDGQLLLSKIGIVSSVGLMARKGEKTNKGTRNQDVWYVQIPNATGLDAFSHRLDLSEGRDPVAKGKYQTIRKVEQIPGRHDVFCLEEPQRHQCVFNNALTLQCNLSEINGKRVKTVEDFEIAARAAAIIGTLQAGYTDFEYLGEVTERIVRREALLGVSITGMMDNSEILFSPDIQRRVAKLVVKTNEEFAAKIGINPAARTTCVKPSGTASCVLGTSSGIHPHHARRYLRRVQANCLEPVFQHFVKVNPLACEKSVWAANDTDEVITFTVEVPNGAKTKNDLSALELLEHVKSTQRNWVLYGKTKERCTKEWLTHSVSNTVNVREEEWNDVCDYIYRNRQWFAGISLLPQSGDLDYPQAPMVNVLTPREILNEYGDSSMLASGLVVDGLHAYGDLWDACVYACGYKEIDEDDERHSLKSDWIRRVQQFAERYCGGDVLKCTRLMKHVNNWKLWLDLKREYKDVDYTTLHEEEDTTRPMDTVACAGGRCDLG